MNARSTQVTTPDGTMNVAGALRSNGCVLIDLFVALACANIVVEVLGIEGNTGFAITAILVVAYTILAQNEVLPSLGRWALGLHRYKYSEFDEYAGNSILIVYEDLDGKIYSARAIITSIVLVCLYFATNLV
jgi:hypothetical protein